MKRYLPWVLVGLLAVGWVADRRWNRGERPGAPTAENIAEITVARPDPSAPEGVSSVRLRVTKSGTNAKPTGAQQPDEWNVTLWYPKPDDDTPARSVHYFGTP